MKYQNIQILRGLAALSVVLWHIREYLAMPAVGNNSHTVFSIITVIFSYGAPLFFDGLGWNNWSE